MKDKNSLVIDESAIIVLNEDLESFKTLTADYRESVLRGDTDRAITLWQMIEETRE